MRDIRRRREEAPTTRPRIEENGPMNKRATWSTPLPRPITIPQVMTLKTLADVRKLLRYTTEPLSRQSHLRPFDQIIRPGP
jgi:hypothetical protein